ncbi:MAG: hypothetical protein ACTHU0_07110, partial [Kofleriaceae bacterium]
MINADTITDEDIRGLCPRSGEELHRVATVALSRHASPEARRAARAARAHCAEIFNARAARDVESAFDDGRLYIEIDAEQRLHPHLSFVARPAKWD